ncbi:2OG-Fe(II) oxygenase [Acidovorax sp. Root267]|uniref:2OG-Fe(II) oxygenase n=1 Tax=Acidovorax sp. Root267 TaxID=1736505 RepID=UPI001124F594|nr:2OG-Fe(II) oxygenase [Acidovorax sp. Root267]
MSVEVMANAMKADGFREPQAQVLAALGVLRHDDSPLVAAQQSWRIQEAAHSLIRYFGPAQKDAAIERSKANGNALMVGPLLPQRVDCDFRHSDDRKVEVRFSCSNPDVVLLDGFLSPQECADIVALARDRVVDSAVMGEKADVVDSEVRSSRDTSLSSSVADLITIIESRVEELVSWPVDHMEELSVVRYGPGEKFLPHWDYFDEASLSNHDHALAAGGQRVGTVVLYLSDVARGGATSFAFAGLDVRPKQGSALYFTYRMPDGSMDPASLHSGEPVLEGEKWIATLWLREKAVRIHSSVSQSS